MGCEELLGGAFLRRQLSKDIRQPGGARKARVLLFFQFPSHISEFSHPRSQHETLGVDRGFCLLSRSPLALSTRENHALSAHVSGTVACLFESLSHLTISNHSG